MFYLCLFLEESLTCIKNNIFMKILWGILVFFFAVFMILLIIAFFFFLGCPYEFVKCYFNRNEKSDDDDDDDDYLSDYENNKKKDEALDDDGVEKPLNWKDYIIIFFLILLGICLQPLYLLFYIMMAMMELYRQCGCWVFFAYS